ncbi:MAG: hypothetical protein QXN68_04375 [Thermoplasmata archaeon]
MIILIMFNFYIKAFLSPDSTKVKIDYYLEKGVLKIMIVYEYKSKNYIVAVHKNQDPYKELKDEFIWFTKNKWRKEGNLKLLLFFDDKYEEYFISGKNLEIKDFLNEKENGEKGLIKINEGHFINPSLIKSYKGPDRFAWRYWKYDVQHTNYYPFPLYKPFKFKWSHKWGGGGSWTTEITPCASYGIFFTGKGHPEWNKVMAKDIETGKIIWEKYLTSNVWTCALDPNDSILFAGTCIGIPPESLPTFFALDPFTGNEKWSKPITTVGFQPIVVDTVVYAPALGWVEPVGYNATFAYNLKGKLLWGKRLTGFPPSYFGGKIYGLMEKVLYDPDTVQTKALCRDALTGNLIWKYILPNKLTTWTSIYDNRLWSFFDIKLLGFNIFTGSLEIDKYMEYPYNMPLSGYNNEIWSGCGKWSGDTIITVVFSFDSKTAQKRLEFYLAPKDTNGGRGGVPVFTIKNMGWVANCDYIYGFKTLNGEVFDTVLLPDARSPWPAWGYPVIYKNYFFAAHHGYIYCYKADTILPETTYIYKFYPYYKEGNIYAYLSLPEGQNIYLKIFDITGRKVLDLYKGYLEKGEYFLPLNISSDGVYFIFLKGKNKEVKKFFKIGR